MDPFNTPMKRQSCRDIYGDLESDSATTKTILCTLVLIICTILLEIFTHARLDCCDFGKEAKDEEAARLAADVSQDSSAIPLTTVVEQPQPQPEPQAEPQPTSINNNQPKPDVTPAEVKKPDFCCAENPTRHVRANRSALSTLLFGLALAAFIIRMQEATARPYRDRCSRLVHATPPNWTAIIFLNIIPFVFASFAFLRTLVDSVLVRWNKTLTYDADKMPFFWAPCMPIMVVFMIAYLLVELVKVPIACLMGDREVSLWTSKIKDKGKKKAEEAEMQSEEAQGLVDNVDGQDDGDDGSVGRPPAYDEVCSPRESFEGKHAADTDTLV
ncbi:hypothetical protein N0V83_000173 [Neocucurbitaria cava]|uniref:Uncharacterized protein n=1 Tax=Neocucurbitaria cava TaxID=798079 RepID=A0A9W9CRR2_9PLEO|nr:hypothetical protein N0V83_000173 [Neocucurbitaria cava]